MDTDEHVIVPGAGAVKLLIFSRKAAHLTTAAYLAHWAGQHKDLVIAQSDFMAFVRGYRQHHVIPDSVCNGVDETIAPSSRFDGVIEQWFDTVEDAVRAYQSTGYQIQVRQDEPSFLSVGASIATFVDERPL